MTLAGTVWADINDDGLIDDGEIGISGVTVTATLTSGPIPFSVSTLTGANGSYSFVEGDAADVGVGQLAAAGSFVLPAGTYTLTETQPVYFVNGKTEPGTPAPTSESTTAFGGITLAPSQSATGFNFGQQGLQAQYVTAYLTDRAFFASADPSVSNLDLAAGPAYFSFDGGTPDLVAAQVQSAGQGSVNLTLYNAANQVVATASGASGSTTLQAAGSPGTPYVLEVSGTNTAVDVEAAALAGPPQVWHNSANPLDVTGDGTITPQDALEVINALNKYGSSPLPLVAAQPNALPDYVDVLNTGSLTPQDALEIINYLNANPPATSTDAPATASLSATASVSSEPDASVATSTSGSVAAAAGSSVATTAVVTGSPAPSSTQASDPGSGPPATINDGAAQAAASLEVGNSGPPPASPAAPCASPLAGCHRGDRGHRSRFEQRDGTTVARHDVFDHCFGQAGDQRGGRCRLGRTRRRSGRALAGLIQLAGLIHHAGLGPEPAPTCAGRRARARRWRPGH